MFIIYRNIPSLTEVLLYVVKENGKDMPLVVERALQVISTWSGLLQTQLLLVLLKSMSIEHQKKHSKPLITLAMGKCCW